MTAELAPEPILISDAQIDPDRFMLEGVDVSKGPKYTVSELAKFFFARSAHWVRWLERERWFVLGGDVTCLHVASWAVVQGKDGSDKREPAEYAFDENGICSKCGGQEVGTGRTTQGARSYTLADVEKIAHALAQRNKISGQQLRHTLHLVRTSGQLYEFL